MQWAGLTSVQTKNRHPPASLLSEPVGGATEARKQSRLAALGDRSPSTVRGASSSEAAAIWPRRERADQKDEQDVEQDSVHDQLPLNGDL
jgi:hypothetical protein